MGSTTGDEAIITAVKRKLMIILDPGATAFTANQDLLDSSTLSGEENAGVSVNIDSLSGEYESREYDYNQKWSPLLADLALPSMLLIAVVTMT